MDEDEQLRRAIEESLKSHQAHEQEQENEDYARAVASHDDADQDWTIPRFMLLRRFPHQFRHHDAVSRFKKVDLISRILGIKFHWHEKDGEADSYMFIQHDLIQILVCRDIGLLPQGSDFWIRRGRRRIGNVCGSKFRTIVLWMHRG